MNGYVARPDRAPGLVARMGVLLVALVLVEGCASAPPATGSPTPAGTVATLAPSQPAPTASAGPTPSPAEAASPPRWEVVASPGDLIEIEAVQLGDGRVLAMGWDVEREARVARLWDPATGEWKDTSALENPRTSFATIALDDGRALVVGGYNEAGKSYSSAYAFDPRTETWAKVGVMDTARTNAAVARLEDGRVLVAGGYYWLPPDEGGAPGLDATLAAYRVPGGPGAATPPPLDDVDVPPHGYALATAELFDPQSGTFTNTGPMKYARPGASIVTLRDGRVLVVGAATDEVTGVDRRAFETAEIYDPATGRFEPAGELPGFDREALEQPGKNPIPDEDPAPQASGALVALPDGGALLIAHHSWWKHAGEISRSFRFDPATISWREIGDTYIYIGEPTRDVLYRPGVPSLVGVLVTSIANDGVLVAGGQGAIQWARGYYNDSSVDARLFDPETDTWSSLPPLPQARQDGVAVALQDGSVLLIGGWTWAREEVPDPAPVRFVPGS